MDCAQFPSYVSSAAENIVRSLCRKNPQERLGSGVGGFNLIRRHKWFKNFNWKGKILNILQNPLQLMKLFPDLRSQTLPAPITPTISNHLDTSCFDNFSTSNSSSGYISDEFESVESGDGQEEEVKMDFGFLDGWNF